jgi:hypothetical protein
MEIQNPPSNLGKSLTEQIIAQIQIDVDNGKFYSICSNETTFKNYIAEKIPEILSLIRGIIDEDKHLDDYGFQVINVDDLLEKLK